MTTSTSLELGIDMPHIDLVVQVGSPKSVASLLQRVGRAGHQLGETVEGRVIALDRDELVECAVMLEKAERGFVDRVFIPENAQDVATQPIYGRPSTVSAPRRRQQSPPAGVPVPGLRRRGLGAADAYLTADYPGMEDKNVYAKIWRDTNDAPDGEHHYEEYDVGEHLIGKRGRLARVIYRLNRNDSGSFTCDVVTRCDDEWVGQLDENYLDTIDSGDVFVLGGEHFEYRYRRGSKVYVDRTSKRPTVPRGSPSASRCRTTSAARYSTFTRTLDRLADGGMSEVRNWLRTFPVDENSVRAIARMFREQVAYAGPDSVATTDRLVIEETLDHDEYERHFYVHSNYGRRFNDGLSRLTRLSFRAAVNANVQVAVADNGFTLSMPLNRKVDVARIVRDMDPDSAARTCGPASTARTSCSGTSVSMPRAR